jgi:hypothetical protein
MDMACSKNRGKVECIWVIRGKARRKVTTGRPRHRPMDNIKTDLGEIGWGGMDWHSLVQDMAKWRAIVKAVMKLWVP